jgi:hypothetical protein
LIAAGCDKTLERVGVVSVGGGHAHSVDIGRVIVADHGLAAHILGGLHHFRMMLIEIAKHKRRMETLEQLDHSRGGDVAAVDQPLNAGAPEEFQRPESILNMIVSVGENTDFHNASRRRDAKSVPSLKVIDVLDSIQ